MIPQYGIRNVNMPYIDRAQPVSIRPNYLPNALYQNYLNTGLNKLNYNQIRNAQNFAKICYE